MCSQDATGTFTVPGREVVCAQAVVSPGVSILYAAVHCGRDSPTSHLFLLSNIEGGSAPGQVVCTCMGSGLLRTHGVAPGHFTHVFIDEASQAMQPETLVVRVLVAPHRHQLVAEAAPPTPCRVAVEAGFLTEIYLCRACSCHEIEAVDHTQALDLAGDLTSVVLAGDHRQLGVAVRSPAAQGLEVSLLEVCSRFSHSTLADNRRWKRRGAGRGGVHWLADERRRATESLCFASYE
jgi:hypothetical protein